MEEENRPSLRDRMRDVILDVDPMWVYLADAGNTDEYDVEIDEILARISGASTREGVLNALERVFEKYFSSKAVQMSQEQLEVLADRIWELLSNVV